MIRLASGLAVAIATVAGALPASAQLVGTSVSGILQFGGGSTNYYAPANGFVPSGYLNTAGSTVTISNSATEFGFADGANTDVTNFSATGFTFTDMSVGGGTSFFLQFTDPAFAGLTLTKVSDSFLNGGLAYSLTGSTITLSGPGFSTGGTYAAEFTLTTPIATPEPASMTLLATGLVAVFGAARRKRKSLS